MNILIQIMMNQINCLHPKFIYNPLLKELIAEHHNYTLFNEMYDISALKSRKFYYENKLPFKVSFESLSVECLNSCFVTDRFTGVCYPIFMQVPCGRCECCQSSKINSLVHRCKLETQFYSSLPIFLTLTYNEENKPKEGVILRDVQLFFKRLRINLYRAGYREGIRYLLVSEYGRKGRPHYHSILWNLHQSDFLSYREITKIIERSWNKGFVCSRFIDTTDDKAFSYTAKYLGKGSHVPSGQNKTFLCSSNRGGGIGRPFVELLKSQVRADLSREVKFCNRFTSKCENIFLNKYILDILFPSFTKTCPPSMRTKVIEYCKCLFILKEYYHESDYFDNDFNCVYNFFSRYFFIPPFSLKEFKEGCIQSREYYLRYALCNEQDISSFLRKGETFYDQAKENDELRQVYLGKLFMYDQPIKSLENRAYNFTRSISLAKQREVL